MKIKVTKYGRMHTVSENDLECGIIGLLKSVDKKVYKRNAIAVMLTKMIESEVIGASELEEIFCYEDKIELIKDEETN